MLVAQTQIDAADVRRQEEELRARSGKLRMRDAAEALKLPEAALLEARLASGEARRLIRASEGPGFAPVIERMGEAGDVMALTRNAPCVHEKHGTYNAPKFFGAMGQVVGEIDLRLFLQHWAYGYALDEPMGEAGTRKSLQFFDASGDAVHKIFATKATDGEAFTGLVDDFTDPEPQPARFKARAAPEPERPDSEIDLEGFRTAWSELEHSHEFYGLLKRFGVARAQAMRLAGEDFARPIGRDAFGKLLRTCSSSNIPVMIFVGNEGCVQIHSGPVERIEPMGPWLNVLDPRFNLHLREDRIAAAYAVRKPSKRGDVHSIELFDADGFCFLQMFGERKPGESERQDWRKLFDGPC